MSGPFPRRSVPPRAKWPWPWATAWEGTRYMFADSDGKMELVRDGLHFIPTTARGHAQLAFIAGELKRLLPGGTTLT